MNGTSLTPGIAHRFRLHNATRSALDLLSRLVHLIICFVLLFIFVIRLRFIAWKDWLYEQKWALIMIYVALLNCNPFFGFSYVGINTHLWTVITHIIECFFYSMLFLFWLTYFDYIQKNDSESEVKFYAPKFALCGLYFIVSSILFAWTGVMISHNPNYPYQNHPGMLFLLVFHFLLIGIYVFWMIYIALRRVIERKESPFLSLRIKIFGVHSIICFIYTTIFIIFGFYGRSSRDTTLLDPSRTLLQGYIYLFVFYTLPSSMILVGINTSGMVKLEDIEKHSESERYKGGEIGEEEEIEMEEEEEIELRDEEI